MRYNHLDMLPEEAFVKVGKTIKLYGKGGGGQQSTTSQVNQSNIPDYAQPYVENMLNATQQQLFQTDSNNQITGFQPYKPYSTDPSNYIAGFSPMQQQAQQGAANLQMPGQYAQASGLAGASGMGSLGMAGQLANTGNQYNQMATNPNATQAFMNPYVQASLAPQLDEMRRQYGISGVQEQGNATQQGAMGGSREALMASENNRNMGTAMNQAIGTGYNNAFQAAQQAQQFGANLGLQGNQAALSGLGQANTAAGTLGQIGAGQLAGQQSILGTQNQLGAQQQAQQQQITNQAIQDYANAQQYPMMQLGMMSNMLRGLPMQATTTQSYQAQPNLISQGIGALGTGISLSNAMGTPAKAEGGVIKSYAKGGLASVQSYDVGGITDDVASKLYALYDSDPSGFKKELSSPSPIIAKEAQRIQKEKQLGLAGGGIIAFKEGDKVEDTPTTEKDRAAFKDWLETVGAAGKDVTSLPGRMLASGYDTGVRGLRAMGSDIDYTDQSVYGGNRNTLTPYTDVLNAKRAAAKPAIPAQQAPQAVPAQATVTPKDYAPEIQVPAPVTKPAPIASRVPAENATPAPSAAYMPSAETTAQGILSAMPKEAQDYMNKNPDNQSIAEIYAKNAADKARLIGPDTAGAEYRKTIMDQKANATDEAYRLQQMRMAQFFSTWGSTPGATLVAGMKAARETIPNLVGDKDDQKKANSELNKIIYGLDNADRLEKEGDWNAASKIKEDQAKNASNWATKWQDLVQNAATNKAHTEGIAASNASAERIAKGRNATDLAVADKRTIEANDTKKYEIAKGFDANYERTAQNIAQRRNGKEYQALARAATMRVTDPNSPINKKADEAQNKIDSYERDWSTELNGASKKAEAAWGRVGFKTDEGSAPSATYVPGKGFVK